MSLTSTALLFSTIISLALLIILTYIKSRSAKARLSPGPKPWPIIGNLFDVPKVSPWATYASWGKLYGDFYQFRIFNQTIVILNSRNVATDLLEKRSNIYSDRPKIQMVDLMGWDFSLVLMPYAVSFRPVQLSKVQNLVGNLAAHPQDFMHHLKNFSASIVLRSMYGYEIDPENDSTVRMAEEAADMMLHAMFPGAMLVNALPILRYIPAWLPGAGFKRFSQKCKGMTKAMQEVPFNIAKEHMESGSGEPCLTSELLDRNKTMGGSAEQQDIIKRVAAVAYSAGADTTTAVISIAIMLMILYPDAQKKAQAEIDKVVGTNRLPDFRDRDSLSYVEAFYREVYRWHPAVPLGVVHSSSKDDIYNGCFVPKGAYVMANIWAMMHDENVYPEPHHFKPERFLNEDGQVKDDSHLLAFGFGRRICPGRHFGDAGAWAAIASLLAAFSFSKYKDAAGLETEMKVGFTDGIVRYAIKDSIRFDEN